MIRRHTRICELKQEYGTELDWVISFIGDCYLLSNYQSVLIRVYYDAGLRDLAECSGHRGETLTSIKKCSTFKRTHQFLLQAWEAMYRQMFQAFQCGDDGDAGAISAIVSAVKANMFDCNIKMSESSGHLKEYMAPLWHLIVPITKS